MPSSLMRSFGGMSAAFTGAAEHVEASLQMPFLLQATVDQASLPSIAEVLDPTCGDGKRIGPNSPSFLGNI